MTGAPPFEAACKVYVLHMEHHSLIYLVTVSCTAVVFGYNGVTTVVAASL